MVELGKCPKCRSKSVQLTDSGVFCTHCHLEFLGSPEGWRQTQVALGSKTKPSSFEAQRLGNAIAKIYTIAELWDIVMNNTRPQEGQGTKP